MVAFAVVTEKRVCAWPGMGKLLIDSINVLDRPVIVAYLLIIVSLFVFIQPAGGPGLLCARPARAWRRGERIDGQCRCRPAIHYGAKRPVNLRPTAWRYSVWCCLC